MTTSNPTNEPKTARASEARIEDRPESQDSRELTPDEEKNIVGGDREASAPSVSEIVVTKSTGVN